MKEDCTQYFECTNGYVGRVHTCTDGFKYDKASERCIPGALVSEFCYGLSQDEEEMLEQELATTEAPSSSPNSIPSSATGSLTTSPTDMSDKERMKYWIMEYENGDTVTRRCNFMWILVFLPILWNFL